MTGSVLDGEDLVQEALAVAVRGAPDESALRPWLFKIAHHKCVDFLRARRPTVELDEGDQPAMGIDIEIETHERAALAFGAALALPPRERASVLLADVLGHSLEEIASVLETSVGSVKAALHRGRGRLAATAPPVRHALSPESQRYAEGRAIVGALDRAGVKVTAIGRDEARLAKVRTESEGRVATRAGDVTDQAFALDVLRSIRPDILVFFAGARPPKAPIHEHT